MALMNMEASNTAQGVASLKDNMEGFLQEFPMWPQDKQNRLNELSGKLLNEELENQAEKCISEYKEVEEMFVRRQETLQRAAVTVQVRQLKTFQHNQSAMTDNDRLNKVSCPSS
jgi:hypothetical protein